MELLSLPSPLTSSLSRKASFLKHPFPSDQNSVTIPDIKRYPSTRKIKFPHFRAQASESVQAISKSDTGTTDEINQEISSKDEDLVFVAGATGKVGSRTVRELLKLGFRVRAGVRSAQRAKPLLQSVQQLNLDDGSSAVEKLEIVECDLEQDKIVPAIGNASIVICCIGASEKEVFDITGPYRIDYQATKNLIDAATVAGVNHFILLTSLGTNKIGFPAAILNLFWGVLIWKRKAEEALIDSGLPYTIVRPGGMERPTDAYKETHNVSLAKEDTLFGGQVSNLQVAELMAFMTKNRDLSYCKVVEVIAETTAPLTPFGDLLSKIPSQRSDTSSPKEPQISRKNDVAASQSIVLGATSSVTKKEPAKTKKPSMTPSSYIIYEDLKPTTSTPRPSTSEADAMNVSVQVEKSKFVPPSAEGSSMEPAKTASVEEPSLKDKQSSGDLSPYVVYDDLKPPTSPSPPTSSSTKGPLNDVQATSESTTAASQISVSGSTTTTTETVPTLPKVLDTRPLSPYFVYEDLKPPSSPTPTSSAHRRGPVGAVEPENEVVTSSSGVGVMEKTSVVVEEKELPKAQTQETRYLSPFPMYDDLKPPASPTPSAPQTASSLSESTTSAGSQLSAMPDSTEAQAALTDKVEDKKHSSESKSKPLSPFHMYEDLKPPSSPTPSPKTS